MGDKRIHFEQYVYLPALTHDSAIVAWGGFYFEVESENGKEEWKLLEDEDIPDRDPARPGSIGLNSKLCGPAAQVEVVNLDSGESRIVSVEGSNHAEIRGLEANTEYRYRVTVLDENGAGIEWGKGPCRDWNSAAARMELTGKNYDNRFKTFPAPDVDVSALNFVVIGDFGRGVRKPVKEGTRCQAEIAEALEKVVNDKDARFMLTTGDNIYAHRKFLIIVSDSGDEDKDWFYTYYQPYRYIINRIPTFPAFGNHDEGESEEQDDRDQLYDNLYVRPHFESLREPQDAVTDRGLLYRFRFGRQIEFICLDTSKDHILARRFFELPENRPFIERVLPITSGGGWRIAFSHHPVYCAGPNHGSRPSLQRLMDERGHQAGVRVFFSGHEHNLQHSQDRITDYFITGGAGKYEKSRPKSTKFQSAKTKAWGGNKQGHFLFCRIKEKKMEISAIGKLTDEGLKSIEINDVGGDVRKAEFTISI